MKKTVATLHPTSSILPFLWIFIFSSNLSHLSLPQFIIWNVGQGLWTTLSLHDACYHIDMGGEFFSFDWSSVKRECQNKKNLVHFTHWDWDHINFTRTALKNFNHLCIVTQPRGFASYKKKAWLKKIPSCHSVLKSHPVKKVHFSIKTNKKDPSQNTFSHVFIIANQILVSGDSPKEQERRWLYQIPSPSSIKFLLLGHHGSYTSTSSELLKKLNRLQTSIASSRYRKYRHPHKKVTKLLKNRSINLLKTQDWGHLHIPVQIMNTTTDYKLTF